MWVQFKQWWSENDVHTTGPTFSPFNSVPLFILFMARSMHCNGCPNTAVTSTRPLSESDATTPSTPHVSDTVYQAVELHQRRDMLLCPLNGLLFKYDTVHMLCNTYLSLSAHVSLIIPVQMTWKLLHFAGNTSGTQLWYCHSFGHLGVFCWWCS